MLLWILDRSQLGLRRTMIEWRPLSTNTYATAIEVTTCGAWFAALIICGLRSSNCRLFRVLV
jgi:hypothetical protein